MECRRVWEEWRAKQVCLHCGTSECIEADHLCDKVHQCSDFVFWTYHGGVEALKKELRKCQPLCRFCHMKKTNAERNPQRDKCKIRRRAIINAEKKKRGVCLQCSRPVEDDFSCFDFDHREPVKKLFCVSSSVNFSTKNFHLVYAEMTKCDLLCCVCHWKKTNHKL